MAQQPSIPAGARYWAPAGRFLGSSVCAECHAKQADQYRAGSMSRALEPAASAEALKGDIHYSYRQGRWSYRLSRQGQRVLYSISNGTDNLSIPLEYAFGQGKAGQTYVYSLGGQYYESRVSYYAATRNLDLTVGAPTAEPLDLSSAAGRPMAINEPRDCFGCHTTGARIGNTLQLESYEPGVQCESCHGPGAAHVEAVRAGHSGKTGIRALKGMTPRESSDFCGTCHRTYQTVQEIGIKGIDTARFPAYRIAGSPCFSMDDPRISCTACHDPHGPLVEDDNYYDSRCGACHNQPGARQCKVARQACTSCHMQRVSPEQAHHAFPDHWIRIVRSPHDYPE